MRRMGKTGTGNGNGGRGKEPDRLVYYGLMAAGVALVALVLAAPSAVFVAIGLGLVGYLLCRWLIG